MPDLHVLRDVLVLFILGVGVVLIADRFRLPPIVGFLITGVLCGPFGFGRVSDTHGIEAIAEIGVMLLLFTVGIEFSIPQLRRIRTFLLLGGGLQVGLTLALAGGAAAALGASWNVAIFVGMLVSLSSTAIVLRLLADRMEVDSPQGRSAIGILIFQDLCVVPMVLATPFLAGQDAGLTGAMLTVGKAMLFIAAAALAARFVIPPLLEHVVRTRKREVFLLTILLICLGSAWASAAVGLSLALGAFIAGLILSESEYNHQALSEVLPLREVFFSLFFVSIGMLFDIRTVLSEPLLVMGAITVVILLKGLINTGIAWSLGQSLRVALLGGLSIAQIGEFAFVLAKVGVGVQLLDEPSYQLFLAVAVGTMALTPLLFSGAPKLASFLERRVPAGLARGRAIAGITPDESGARLEDHVIIVGFGMNGRNVARVLRTVQIPFVAIELNPDTVRTERAKGTPIIYGDSTRREVLEHAGIHRARVLVIGISDLLASRASADAARRLNSDLHIIVRSRYVQEMEHLYAVGTNEVVAEEFETSIEIFSRVLQRFLVPQDIIERSIVEVRRDGYEMFRTIAGAGVAAAGVDRYLAGLSLAVYRVEHGSALVGVSLERSGIRERSGCSVIAIQPPAGETKVNPPGIEVLEANEAVLVVGTREQVAAARALFQRLADADPGLPMTGDSGLYRKVSW